jgi:hypothetical protein
MLVHQEILWGILINFLFKFNPHHHRKNTLISSESKSQQISEFLLNSSYRHFAKSNNLTLSICGCKTQRAPATLDPQKSRLSTDSRDFLLINFIDSTMDVTEWGYDEVCKKLLNLISLIPSSSLRSSLDLSHHPHLLSPRWKCCRNRVPMLSAMRRSLFSDPPHPFLPGSIV